MANLTLDAIFSPPQPSSQVSQAGASFVTNADGSATITMAAGKGLTVGSATTGPITLNASALSVPINTGGNGITLTGTQPAAANPGVSAGTFLTVMGPPGGNATAGAPGTGAGLAFATGAGGTGGTGNANGGDATWTLGGGSGTGRNGQFSIVGGLLTANAGLTITGAAVNLNASSNFPVNVATGTSTGAVAIGNSLAGAVTIASGAASSWVATGGLTFQALTTGNITLSPVAASPVVIGTGLGLNVASGTINIPGTPTAANAIAITGLTLSGTSQRAVYATVTYDTSVTTDAVLFQGQQTLTVGSTIARVGGAVIGAVVGNGATVTKFAALGTDNQTLAVTNNFMIVDGNTQAPTGCINVFGFHFLSLTGGTTLLEGLHLGAMTGTGTTARGINVGVVSGASAVNIGVDIQTPTGTGALGLNVQGAGATIVGATTVSGGIISLNSSSNFATNINTGTSSGAVTIGSAANAGAIGIRSAAAITIQAAAASSWSTSAANLTLSTVTSGTLAVVSAGLLTLTGVGASVWTPGDGATIVAGSTTGLQIATATTQKLGFFAATPSAQIAGSVDALAWAVTLGFRAASSNPPLNLGTGTLTAGALTSSGVISTTVNGALSAPAVTGTGTWITGGTGTTTKPYLLVEPSGTTSTGWSTSGTGIGVNAAVGFGGNLLDLQLAGVSGFKVASNGATTINAGGLTVLTGNNIFTDVAGQTNLYIRNTSVGGKSWLFASMGSNGSGGGAGSLDLYGGVAGSETFVAYFTTAGALLIASSLTVQTGGALITGNTAVASGTFTSSGGAISLNATTAFGVTIGNATSTAAVNIAANAASTWQVTAGNLTVGTLTSGTLAITSAGALNLTGVAASTLAFSGGAAILQATSQNLTVQTVTSGTLAMTSAGAVNVTSAAASTWAGSGGTLTIQSTSQALTLQTLTSGTLTASSAGALTLTGASASTWSLTAGALTIQNSSANLTIQTQTSGTLAVVSAGLLTLTGVGASVWTPGDGATMVLGTTTGLKIGTATTQKLGIFNAAPVAQQSGVGTATGYTAGATAATFHSDDTYTGNVGLTGYTINGVVAALKNFGLLAS